MRRWWAVTGALLLAGLVLAGTAAVAKPGDPPSSVGCPDPRTCRAYSESLQERWPADPDGITRLRYVIREPMPPGISLKTFRGAVAAAARTWNAAGAKVLLIDAGVVPANYLPLDEQIDGIVGWSPEASVGLASETEIARPDTDNDDPFNDPLNHPAHRMFLISFNAAWPTGWTWQPCGGGAGPCTFIPRDLAVPDLQTSATHEFGHTLGHVHVDDDVLHREMTMHPNYNTCGANGVCRKRSTLGLGDMLQVHRRYGTRHAMPRVEVP